MVEGRGEEIEDNRSVGEPLGDLVIEGAGLGVVRSLGVEDVVVGSDRLAEIRIDDDSGTESGGAGGEEHDSGAGEDLARFEEAEGDGDCSAGAARGPSLGGGGGGGSGADLFDCGGDGELAFGDREEEGVFGGLSEEVADLGGGEVAVAVEEEKGGEVGVAEAVEVDEGVEGEEGDEGVVGEVVEEVEEVVLEGEEVVVRGGEVEEEEEGGGRGRGRGRGREERVLDGAVGGKELGGEVGVGDGAGKGIAAGAEGAVPDA